VTNKLPLLILIGPTAVGKTELSLRLAERLDGEIVSADSRYFYRGMDIGTAKPSAAEMARVRHHLVDVADPDQTWSLAVFQQAAHEAIGDIHARGKLPVLVGGTGQYVRAVTEGWTPPEVAPDARLREVLEKMASERGEDGIHWLHAKLAILDPDAAAKIDPRNLRRTVRALEVILSTGRLFSRQTGKSGSAYGSLTVGLNRPRAELYQRIDQRIDLMFQNDFLDEVARLYEKGYGPELPSMSAIGYREAGAVLRGEMSVEEAIIQMRRLTRMYVRRQANWFKPDDPEIQWFDAGQVSLEEIQDWAVGKLASLRGM
jgi:tRNA dimethylallyltransferase